MIIQFQLSTSEVREAFDAAAARNNKFARSRNRKFVRWLHIASVSTGVLIAVAIYQFDSLHSHYWAPNLYIAGALASLFFFLNNLIAYLLRGKLWPLPFNLLIFLVSIVMFSFDFYMDQNHPPLVDMVAPHAIWFGLATFNLIATTLTRLFVSRRFWDHSADVPITADIDVSGLTLTSELFRNEFRWPAFTGSEETKSLFLLYSDRTSLILPKAAFRTDEELSAMRAMLRLASETRPSGFPVNIAVQ